ncbi:hypothetical protein TNCV_970691 [Trichonephila clavipes]|nr:hypothetical protein TNCV_970691 [Trichonephila clavipes]
MATVDFLHHENPPTWVGSNPQPWVQKASDKPTMPPVSEISNPFYPFGNIFALMVTFQKNRNFYFELGSKPE